MIDSGAFVAFTDSVERNRGIWERIMGGLLIGIRLAGTLVLVDEANHRVRDDAGEVEREIERAPRSVLCSN